VAWPAQAAQAAQIQPELLVANSPVRQGGTVKLSGHAPATSCSSVTLSSDAFVGSTTTGEANHLIVGVSKTDQTFSTSVDLSYSVGIGSYSVSAACVPPASSGAPFATATVAVQSLLPLDAGTHEKAQLIAAAVILGLLLLILLMIKGAKIFRGYDNRLSTSKTIALMWTPVVAYIVLVLGFIGTGGGYGLWKALIGSINGVYLVVLGAPFAGALGAKAIVSTRVGTGSLQKPPASTWSLGDLFQDDNGEVDVMDSQYLLLNAVAIIVVLVEFVHRPGFGAPDLPWFLGALTGTSAGAYLANKAVQTNNAPSINTIQPIQARIGQAVRAVGANLNPAAATSATTSVTVDGNSADPASISATATLIEFRVPAPPNGAYPVGAAEQVVVTTAAKQVVVSPQDLTVVGDNPSVTGAQSQRVRPGDPLTVSGVNLFRAADLTFDGPPTNAAVVQINLQPAGGGALIPCPRTDPPATNDNDSQVTVTVPAPTPPGRYTIFSGELANGNVTVNVGAIVESIQHGPPPIGAGDPFVVRGQFLFPTNQLTGGKPNTDADPQVTLVPVAGGADIPCPRVQPPSQQDSNTQVRVQVPNGTADGDYTVTIPDADPTAPPVSLHVGP
jgi:hypothetical protein